MPDTSYDEVPYLPSTHAATHPDRLAAVATLLGVDPPPPEHCRVLELGCASGQNLIAMAEALPTSSFVGVDSSTRQVTDGRASVAELALGNVTLHAMDIREIGSDLGEFDYVIAHGVFSWVPFEVQERILDVARRHLVSNGVAYVSYNALPGWRGLGMLRDLLRYSTRHEPDALARSQRARAVVEAVAVLEVEGQSEFAASLGRDARRLHARLAGLEDGADSYLLHEFLASVNEPLYLSDFVERARRHGLQFLAEAGAPFPRGVGEMGRVGEALRLNGDVIEREQYSDFIRGRMFRRTLLVHEGVRIDRSLASRRVERLSVASQAVREASRDSRSGSPGESARFRAADGATLDVDDQLTTAAIGHLAEIWPRAVPFGELADAVLAGSVRRAAACLRPRISTSRALLGRNLVVAHSHSNRLVELRARPPRVAGRLSERPIASAAARMQARRGAVVTNAYHDSVRLDERDRWLVQRLDGTQTADMLPSARGAPPSEPGELERRLVRLMRHAVLIG